MLGYYPPLSFFDNPKLELEVADVVLRVGSAELTKEDGMNKAYKVVFNKVRGTLMVVNEATSLIQNKGLKTIVAATVAAAFAIPGISAETTHTNYQT